MIQHFPIYKWEQQIEDAAIFESGAKTTLVERYGKNKVEYSYARALSKNVIYH